MSDQLNIWVQLVDPNGNLLKNWTAVKVTVASSSDVYDLGRAVKAENPNTLSHVDTPKLKVYKNREDLRADKHLRASNLVIGLGETEENALLVMVPDDSEHIMKRPKMGYDEPEVLMPFDTSSLLTPNEVDVTPFLEEKEPPFIAQENWLENVTQTVCENMMSQDGGQRVPSMAFVRCSVRVRLGLG